MCCLPYLSHWNPLSSIMLKVKARSKCRTEEVAGMPAADCVKISAHCQPAWGPPAERVSPDPQPRLHQKGLHTAMHHFIV